MALVSLFGFEVKVLGVQWIFGSRPMRQTNDEIGPLWYSCGATMRGELWLRGRGTNNNKKKIIVRHVDREIFP